VIKRGLIALGALAFFWYVVIPLFERFAPREVVRAYQRLTMPFFRPMCGVAPGYGVVETTGRRTGLKRQVPVGGGRIGDSFWLVAAIGRSARFVRNIEADPCVRVRFGGKWHTGTAHLCPDDDARKRMFRVSPMNGLFLWTVGGDPLSIRIDLDA
jgi:deazaflavin-dependent oxidoreductase (nitroreductase family)